MRGLRYLLTILLAILFLGGTNLLPADEVSAVWTRLYERADSIEQKRQIMMNIVEQDNRDLVPVLSDALAEQVSRLENVEETTKKQRQQELMKMIVEKLGELRANQTAELVWQVVQSAEDPILRGEAAYALGRMRATQYGDDLAMMLRNLNFNYDDIQNQRANEIMAYSLVLALKRLQVPEAFTPLFFASQGWYSGRSGVKEKAKEALGAVVDDPSDQLRQIIRNNPDLQLKLVALEAERNSDAPAEGKARVAAAALDEGLSIQPENVKETQRLKNLRLEALRILKNTPFPEEGELLENMEAMISDYRSDRLYEADEMITLLDTMGSFPRDDVAEALNGFLIYMTERRNDGITMSLRIAKQTIQSLADTGREIGMEGLTMVTVSDQWEGSVRRAAEAALKRLQEQ